MSVFLMRTRKDSCGRQARLSQTFGRAARNTHGQVVLYADTVTDSMKKAMDETNRRRAKQIAYNEGHAA